MTITIDELIYLFQRQWSLQRLARKQGCFHIKIMLLKINKMLEWRTVLELKEQQLSSYCLTPSLCFLVFLFVFVFLCFGQLSFTTREWRVETGPKPQNTWNFFHCKILKLSSSTELTSFNFLNCKMLIIVVMQ